MESLPDHHPDIAPGHKLSDFVRIGRRLQAAGIHTPDIIDAEPARGYALLEDMGDVSFAAALDEGENAPDLYAAATDVLIHLQTSFSENDLALPDYFKSHIHKGRRRVVDWYIPACRRTLNEDGLADSYMSAWHDIEKNLPPCPLGFVHSDYHAGNIMWLAEQKGMTRCGILDFQGGHWGPLPYDAVNLLRDARRDIPADIESNMLSRLTEKMNKRDAEYFRIWYDVLALQFHLRVIGQVIRLALKTEKTQHLKNIPRLQAYIRQEIKNPAFTPLYRWFTGQGIGFDEIVHLPGTESFIRPDAF